MRLLKKIKKLILTIANILTVLNIFYSTDTDLARFLGLSTSHPRATAI
jgi:hypothetical protein